MKKIISIMLILTLILFSGCSGSYEFQENQNGVTGQVQVDDEVISGEVKVENSQDSGSSSIPQPPALPED